MYSRMIIFLIIACVITLTPNVVRTKCLDDNLCLSPNPTENCHKVIYKTIDLKYRNSIEAILDAHNSYRRQIARGSKNGYKQASNMMELTWDQKLADLAQQQANTCNEEIDEACTKCLMDDGIVQNTYTETKHCPDEDQCYMYRTYSLDDYREEILTNVFQQPKNAHKVNITSLSEMDYKNFGTFIKMITAKTDKIGCGYIAYRKKAKGTASEFHQIYVCNYSPSAKISEEVYKVGPYCSKCPPDTCCGPCINDEEKRGICHVKTEADREKEYAHPFNCDFTDKRECEFTVTGTNRWEIEDNTLKTTLKSGEKSTVVFTKKAMAKKDFEILLEYDTGFFVDSSGVKKAEAAVMKLILQQDQSEPISIPLKGQCQVNVRCTFYTDLIKPGIYKMSLDISVPDGASRQYFLLYKIRVLNKEI